MPARALLIALLTALAACRDAKVAPPSPEPLRCTDGERETEAGCVPLLAESCPAGTRPVLGREDCVPTGATACGSGFAAAADGWGCTPVVAARCDVGTMPVLGSEACEPVGPSACPAGSMAGAGGCTQAPLPSCTGATRESWRTGACVPLGACAAPASADRFVDASFTAAELDGRHFRTISDAVKAAAAGETVAIAAGTYAESVYVAKSLHLVGACAETVVVTRGAGQVGLASAGAGVSVTADGMTFEGHDAGLVAFSGARLTVSRSRVANSRGVGAWSSGAGSALQLVDSVVEGTRPGPSSAGAEAVSVDAGCSAELTGCVLRDNSEVGLFATGAGASLVARDTVVRDMRLDARGGQGNGAYARQGAAVTLSDSVVDRAATVGAIGFDAGTTLALLRSTVRDTRPSAAGGDGEGVDVNRGARLTIEGSALVDNPGHGVVAAQSPASLTDVRISSTATGAGGANGLVLLSGATVTLSRVVVEGPFAGGAVVRGVGTRVTAERLAVALAGSGQGADVALDVRSDATFTCTRCAFTGVTAYGAEVVGAVARFDGLVVRGGASPSGAGLLAGLAVQDGGSVVVGGAALSGVFGAGVVVGGPLQPGSLRPEAAHVVVRDLVSEGARATSDAGARGLQAGFGGKLEAAGVTLRDTQGVGVAAFDRGTVAVVSDATVVGTRAGGPFELGYGVAAIEGAVARLDRVAIVDSGATGLLGYGAAPTLSLTDSLISATRVAADGYHGHGALMEDSALFSMTNSAMDAHPSAALLFSRAGGLVRRSVFSKNAVVFHVQDGTALEQGEADAAQPGKLVVSPDTLLRDNAVRVGSGTLPLVDPFSR